MIEKTVTVTRKNPTVARRETASVRPFAPSSAPIVAGRASAGHAGFGAPGA